MTAAPAPNPSRGSRCGHRGIGPSRLRGCLCGRLGEVRSGHRAVERSRTDAGPAPDTPSTATARNRAPTGSVRAPADAAPTADVRSAAGRSRPPPPPRPAAAENAAGASDPPARPTRTADSGAPRRAPTSGIPRTGRPPRTPAPGIPKLPTRRDSAAPPRSTPRASAPASPATKIFATSQARNGTVTRRVKPACWDAEGHRLTRAFSDSNDDSNRAVRAHT
jgi:hypothetical protein